MPSPWPRDVTKQGAASLHTCSSKAEHGRVWHALRHACRHHDTRGGGAMSLVSQRREVPVFGPITSYTQCGSKTDPACSTLPGGAARSHLSFSLWAVCRSGVCLSVTAAAAPRTGHIFGRSVLNVCPDFRFSSRNCSYRFKAVSRTLITEHRLRREKNVNASHRPAKTSGSRVFYAPQRARRGRLPPPCKHPETLWCEEIIGVDRGTLLYVR